MEDVKMTNFEMVDMLCERTHVSYAEAKEALEASNWDMLEAVMLLEREGKASGAAAQFSTKGENDKEYAERDNSNSSFKSGLHKVLGFAGKILNIGNSNSLLLERSGKTLISMPVTAAAVLILFMPWLLVAMLVSLFFGCRYSFKGAELGQESINGVMDKASDVAENVKSSVEKEILRDRSNKNSEE